MLHPLLAPAAPIALAALGLLLGQHGLPAARRVVTGLLGCLFASTWLGSALLALAIAAVAELARRPWQHIALRVLASWPAASAALALGLQWAGPLPLR